MSWLNQIKPVVLHQSSELPYVILEDGVRLCFSNFYAMEGSPQDRFVLEFNANKAMLERQSATYYKFRHFPVIIPFADIVKLNTTIIHGKIIRSASYKRSKHLSVALMKSEYVDGLDSYAFDNLTETLRNYDKTMLLTSDRLGESSHLLMDDVSPVYNAGDWGRVAVAIADVTCPLPSRKFCWTKACPDMSISCFGFEPDNISDLNDHIVDIGIRSFDLHWSDLDE